MKRLVFSLALLCLAPVPTPAVVVNDCSLDVLPEGARNCVYSHIEYASFSYAGGRLRVTWPERYTVQDAVLIQDWKPQLPYVPGSKAAVEFKPGSRYDVVARFVDTQTGERILGVTPISCTARIGNGPGLELTPAPVEGCAISASPLTCLVRTEVDCTDGDGNPNGSASAECSGDTGSCNDNCSDSETACCTSQRTRTETDSSGTHTTVTEMEQTRQDCPGSN